MAEQSRIFSSTQSRAQAFAVLAVLAIVVGFGGTAVVRYLPWIRDPEAVRAYIQGFGVFAPLVFILLQAVQVIIAPIPGTVLGFAAGYLFGPVRGTIYSLIGVTIGSMVVFGISRMYGRPYVERVIHPATIERFDGFIERRGSLAFFIIFLVPGLPDDVVSLMAGVTRISVWKLLPISIIGRLPGFFLIAVAGASFADDRPLLGVAILILFAVAGIAAFVYNKRIFDS